MKKVILVMLILSYGIFAQNYRTIETENVRVVFERGLEDEAKETANYIESLKKYYGESFEGNLKSIPIILRKGNNFSNAHFTPFPNKLDYITVAPITSDLGVTPWIMDLSIHEYRHFMQYQLVRKNSLNKVGYFLGGNMYTFAMGFLTVPNWVWEGDATSFETRLSNNGRGRTPNFLKNYRAILSENKEFSYEKAKNSSYKDKVPNAYDLGYLLVSYGYEKFGSNFWNDVFIEGSGPMGFTPFSKVLEEKTGMSSKEFYKEALSYFEKRFNEEKKVNYKNVLEEDKVPTNYSYAYDYGNQLITLKRSYDERSAFYEVKENTQKSILDTGFMTDDYYEVKNGKIIWTEIEPDLKKEEVNYSVVKIYDLEKNEKISLTKKTYYYSPSLSNDTKEIAVIKNNGYEMSNIDILDIKGNLIKSLENKENYFYNYIKWVDESNLVVVLRDKNGKMGMKKINVNNMNEEELIPFDNYILSVPFVNGDDIYFSGSFDLVENIYKVNIKNKEIKKITESNIGTHGVTIVKDRLYFSEYSSEGYKLKYTDDLSGVSFKASSLLDDEKINMEYLKNSEIKLADKNEHKDYEVKEYNYIKHMVNIHSWGYSYAEDVMALSLLSTNELSDLNLSLSYENDFRNDKNSYAFTGEFTKYWPKLELLINKVSEDNKDYTKTGIAATFPYYMSKDGYGKIVDLETGYYKLYKTKSNYNILNLKAEYINGKLKSKRDIISENAQDISVDYYTDINDNKNNTLSLNLAVQAKCFMENDGFLFRLNAMENKGNRELYDSSIISRGYEEEEYKTAVKNSFDYFFPIAYPDWGDRGFFLQRVRGDLFYDTTSTKDIEVKNHKTLGLALDFDTTFFSIVPVQIKTQYSYLFDNKSSKVSVGFNIDM